MFRPRYFLLVLLIFMTGGLFAVDQPRPELALHFLHQGHLLRINQDDNTVTRIGSFNPNAPEVDRSPDGRFWGRGSGLSLTALDTDSATTTRIDLPYRPYRQIILPNGKAYVTHNNLTPKGFPLSVVDTRNDRFLTAIEGLSGLATGLATAGEFIYMTAIGVGENDFLYLYRIDSRSDTQQLLHSYPRSAYHWEPMLYGEQVLLCSVAGEGNDLEPRIDIYDPESGRVRSLRAKRFPGIRRFVTGLTPTDDLFLAGCDTESGPGIAEFNDKLELHRVYPLSQSVQRLIGSLGRRIYFTTPEDRLLIYDRRRMSEKTIDLEPLLQGGR